MITTADKQFMRRAVELSWQNFKEQGAPFAAVIVQGEEVVAEGCSLVKQHHDPLAHAVMVAINQATKKLRVNNLSNCRIYTSCEPCIMCLAAIYWADLGAVFYANTQFDLRQLGLDDSFLYSQINLPYPERSIPFQQVPDSQAIEVLKI